MIIMLVSPDKLTLSMFSNFCTKRLQGVSIGVEDLNCLFDKQYQIEYLNQALLTDNPQTVSIVKYKIKPQTKKEMLLGEVKTLPTIVLWFDLYSMHAEVLGCKDQKFLDDLLVAWDEHVKKMNA